MWKGGTEWLNGYVYEDKKKGRPPPFSFPLHTHHRLPHPPQHPSVPKQRINNLADRVGVLKFYLHLIAAIRARLSILPIGFVQVCACMGWDGLLLCIRKNGRQAGQRNSVKKNLTCASPQPPLYTHTSNRFPVQSPPSRPHN